jgi:hypothetical protein
MFFSTQIIKLLIVNKKFIKFIAKTLDFGVKIGYIITVSVSTLTLTVLKIQK